MPLSARDLARGCFDISSPPFRAEAHYCSSSRGSGIGGLCARRNSAECVNPNQKN
jgi:hypothetical protein